MTAEIYLNGEFLPAQSACISVMDRGFLFGDGVYEVIPCYRGRLFRLDHHLQRLDDSLQGIRMDNPLTKAQWAVALQQLVDQLPGEDQSVYLQVTRGAAGVRDHAIPTAIRPTVFMMTNPMPQADPAVVARGISAITLPDSRWEHCNIKAITLLANVLLRSEARDRQAAEAILLRDGRANEGAASNLFIVSNGVLVTPPKSPHLLPGITRDLVLELAQAHGIPTREDEILEQELTQADEIWLTSSTKEILPVIKLNEALVGDGAPGPLFRRMTGLYGDYKRKLQEGRVE